MRLINARWAVLRLNAAHAKIGAQVDDLRRQAIKETMSE